MAKIIKLKLPSKYFEKDRNNRLEARLAKFKLKKGDIIRFLEWDEKSKKYTSQFFDKKVKDFHKIKKAVKYWKQKDLQKYGFYILEFEKI